MSDSIDDILFIHRKKKLKNIGNDFVEDIKFNIKKEKEAKLAKVTEEQKNQFMKNFKNGMTFGEAYRQAGIEDIDSAIEVFKKYIKTVDYIDWDKVY